MATKIMFLVDYYGNPQAGTEGQLLQLIQHLDRSRYEPAMTVLRRSEYIESRQFPCPVNVLGIEKLASFRTIAKIVRYALALRWEGYQLVHCYFNDTALIAPFFMKLSGINVLVSRRDMGFWYTPYNLVVLRLVAPFVDRYVANSHAVKQRVQQQEWVSPDKIVVIYNGYTSLVEKDDQPAAMANLPGIPDDALIVGIVANLKPIKRMDTLIEAFACISKYFSGAYLVIVGDKTTSEAAYTLEKLGALARHFGIEDRVVFTGQVRDSKLYIRRFTVAVLCSESEGFSNSIIEYLQAGRPTVCTDTGGNAEVIQTGRNGFLIPIGDSKALADYVIRLFSDRTLARRVGEAGYESVRAYTHTRMVAEQMACYDGVISANGGNRRNYRWSGRV